MNEPEVPFCAVCHGSGGKEIPATWTSPPEFDACLKCDGQTSQCSTEWCWCKEPKP